ncbi:hypothetical protein KP509_01G130200 [Ceratopteris richardii]|nr:hypothetical protein KP509_01G130200 [Ceratopteris richardii]
MCWAPAFTLQVFVKSLLIGLLFDLILLGGLKSIFRRPRPVYNKGMFLVLSVDHYSFPSGHSSRVFLIFVFVLSYASEWKEATFTVAGLLSEDLKDGIEYWETLSYYMMPFIFACWAAATAGSRILLGRHFLLDVVAGSLVGILEACFVIRYLLGIQVFLDYQQQQVFEYARNLVAILNLGY